MATQVTLPTDKKLLAEAVRRQIQAALPRLNIRCADWQVVYHYLQGVREFREINYRTGRVSVGFYDNKGHLDYKHEDILGALRTELGRLHRLDIRPTVNRRGSGLDSLRDASVSKVALETMLPAYKMAKLKNSVLPPFIRYGMVGLYAYKRKDPERGIMVPEIEVVMPWELMPVPANISDESEMRGIMRHRWVDLEWLYKQGEMGKAAKENKDKLEVKRVSYGDSPQDGVERGVSGVTIRMGGDSIVPNPEAEQIPEQQFVQLTEVWLYQDEYRVGRYIVYVPKVILHDKEFEGKNSPLIPLRVAKYDDQGGFYGRGFAEPLIPLSAEVESALQNLFRNLQEIDVYGILCVPTSLGIERADFTATGHPRVLFYEQDYAMPDAKPFALEPINARDLPGVVVDLGAKLADRITKHSEMLSGDAPGRVDSAAGLGLLYEMSTIPLTGPTASLSAAFAGVYMSMLDMVRKDWKQLDVSSLTLSDPTVVGLSLDPKTGAISLKDRPIPSPLAVDVTIMSQGLTSPEQRKMELVQELKQQTISAMEYRIQARREALDLPVGNDQEWENYRRAVYNVLSIFGDGTNPGDPVLSQNDMPEVHIHVLSSFMARPEYNFADVKVRNQFENALDFYKRLQGEYPDQLPFPEDIAEMEKSGDIPLGAEQAGPPPLTGALPPGSEDGAAAQGMGGLEELMQAMGGGGEEL